MESKSRREVTSPLQLIENSYRKDKKDDQQRLDQIRNDRRRPYSMETICL